MAMSLADIGALLGKFIYVDDFDGVYLVRREKLCCDVYGRQQQW